MRRGGILPAETSSFVGRRAELGEARRKLTAARLISLVGPGGVGKTRLALHIAAELSVAPAFWVELADVRDPALIGHAVLAALDLRDQSATDPTALLRSHLRDRELLLVLDSCEHLLDPVAGLVDDLLRAAAGLRVLATSREPLSIAGEYVLPVPPMDLPPPDGDPADGDAVRLVAERAAAATASFELTGPTGARWPRCAAGSTGCRSRSNWPRCAPGC